MPPTNHNPILPHFLHLDLCHRGTPLHGAFGSQGNQAADFRRTPDEQTGHKGQGCGSALSSGQCNYRKVQVRRQPHFQLMLAQIKESLKRNTFRFLDLRT